MKLSALRESQILAEMAAKKACPVCGHGMANFHFYRNGGWYCKTTSLKSPAPGANVAACQQALAAGQAPRVSGGAAPASSPSKATSSSPTTPTSSPQPAAQAAPVDASTTPTKPLDALQQKIDKWLTDNEIDNYTINEDNTVSIAGNLNLIGLRYKALPVTFSDVTGDVVIVGGMLESLKGLPNEIGGELSITDAENITLLGAPQVIESLSLNGIKLMTLKHANFKEIKGSVSLTKMALTDLKGLPAQIGGNFLYQGRINSLEGCPTHIGGSFKIDTSATTKPLDMQHMPKVIGKSVSLDVASEGISSGTAPDLSGCTTGSIVVEACFQTPLKLPDVVQGHLVLSSKSVKDPTGLTVANLPSEIQGHFVVSAGTIANISKIHQQLKKVNGTITLKECAEGETNYRTQTWTPTNIHLGPLLGLTMIKGVQKIILDYPTRGSTYSSPLKMIQQTLDRVLAGDIDVFEAQEILIDAGYTKQAKL